jgi:hypothetical protein
MTRTRLSVLLVLAAVLSFLGSTGAQGSLYAQSSGDSIGFRAAR